MCVHAIASQIISTVNARTDAMRAHTCGVFSLYEIMILRFLKSRRWMTFFHSQSPTYSIGAHVCVCFMCTCVFRRKASPCAQGSVVKLKTVHKAHIFHTLHESPTRKPGTYTYVC